MPEIETETYNCACCNRDVPLWFGAADDFFEVCDDCFGILTGMGLDTLEHLSPEEKGAIYQTVRDGVRTGDIKLTDPLPTFNTLGNMLLPGGSDGN